MPNDQESIADVEELVMDYALATSHTPGGDDSLAAREKTSTTPAVLAVLSETL